MMEVPGVQGVGSNRGVALVVGVRRNSVALVGNSLAAVVPLTHQGVCFHYLPQEPLAVAVAAEADRYGFQILE